ncbi:MAG: pyruvate kinase [Bdellovibrionales bacterium]|nr:pyruvate kinase [Bdellovibrionales bacterium]
MKSTFEKKAKIIATLGPSVSTKAKIKELIEAGADVLRLNFSHGSIKQHVQQIQTVRSLSKSTGKAIGIMADMPGPKLRIGSFASQDPVYLARHSQVVLTTRKVPGSSKEIPLSFSQLPSIVKKDDQILLADGLFELKVRKVKDKDIHCEVIVGGELRQLKGINIPGRYIPISPFTKKDREILEQIVKEDIDYVALSFIQKASDIVQAKKWMQTRGRVLPIIAKIEKPQAVEDLNPILKATDFIMIARGDLGVELPTEKVPVVQKQIISESMKYSVPVITATQMLDSMTFNPRPTRAEATDVANAIWDGTDALMLSGETAMGQYPKQSVQTMVSIIKEAESSQFYRFQEHKMMEFEDSEALLHAVKSISEHPGLHAIVTYTESGSTTLKLSKLRPRLPIYALTPNKGSVQKLSLGWNIQAIENRKGRNVETMIKNGDQCLIKSTPLKKGQKVILVAGTGLSSGATNMLKIHRLGDTL